MENNACNIWSSAKSILAETLTQSVYERWVSVIRSSHLEEDTLHLTVPSGLYVDWLQDNYLPVIQKAVKSVDEAIENVAILVDKNRPQGNQKQKREKQAPKPKPKPKKRDKNETLNNNYTFDDFVVGASNSFSHAAALAVAQSPATAYNPLFIYGGVGLGKTHLMHAIGNYVYQHKQKSICYTSSEAFVNEYINSLQSRKLSSFRKKYRNMDILLIDDIHFLAGKDRMQEEFFHTFNSLHNNKKQIVLTSDKSPGDLSGLEHRLVSRFEWGMVTQLEQPDLETRMAILKNKAKEFKVWVPEDTILYLAEHVRSNVRRLEGSLIRISTYMSLKQQDNLSQAELEHLLHDILEQEQYQTVTIDKIQKRVADCYSIEHHDILGKKRVKTIAFPRQVAMYLAREMTSDSFPEIGRAFNRNHATILHACKNVESRLSKNSQLRNTLISIKKGLQ